MSSEQTIPDVPPMRWQTVELPMGVTVQWMYEPVGLQDADKGDRLVTKARLSLPCARRGSCLVLIDEIEFRERLGLFGANLNADWGRSDGENSRTNYRVVISDSWLIGATDAIAYCLAEIEKLRVALQARAYALKSEGWEIVETARAMEEKQ